MGKTDSFTLNRTRTDAYTKEEVLVELKRVAKEFSGESFSTRDFARLSKTCSYQAVFRIFKTWENALDQVGVKYKRHFSSRKKITDKELFDEMEKIWAELGHRPSRREWTQQNPKYSYKAYSDRFGGWVAACGSFIEYKSGALSLSPAKPSKQNINSEKAQRTNKSNVVGSRDIPLKLRFKIMDRDGYRCVTCGKSPATDIGTKLHIDHVIPYSKGGRTIYENLRTLCQHCNWGKGAD